MQTRTLTSPSVLAMLDEFDLSLQAQRKSAKTRRNYRDAVEQLSAFLTAAGMPTAVASIRREHVESFLVHLEEIGRSPSTVATRYRGLQQFFKYVAEEGETEVSPMARMKPPKLPEVVVDVISDDDLRKLLKACEGRNFADRRDAAIVWLLLDGGIRIGELLGIKVSDVDFETKTVLVTGKGDRARIVPFEAKTALALRRYLRERAASAYADRKEFWLGVRGPLTDFGVRRLLDKRAEAAGIGHIHAHQFRHTFSHKFLASGGRESDLMRLAGWRSPDMVRRYGSAVADQRARDAHRDHSPAESL